MKEFNLKFEIPLFFSSHIWIVEGYLEELLKL